MNPAGAPPPPPRLPAGGLCQRCSDAVRRAVFRRQGNAGPAAEAHEMQPMNLPPADDPEAPHRPETRYASDGLRCRHCRHCPQKKARWCLAIMGIFIALVAVGLGIRGMTQISQRLARPCPTALPQNQRYMLQNSNHTRPSSCGGSSSMAIRTRREAPPTTARSPVPTTASNATNATSTPLSGRTSSTAAPALTAVNTQTSTNGTNSTTTPAAVSPSSAAASTTSATSATHTPAPSPTPTPAPTPTTGPLVREATYTQDMANHVHPLWECRQERTLTLRDGEGGCMPIRVVSLQPPNGTQVLGDVLIVQGRGECSDKWEETMVELQRSGYNVHTYDQPGQGLSHRYLPDPHVGYIPSWSNYTSAMQGVVGALGLGQGSPLHIIGHSMGGAITCRWLETTPAPNTTSVTLSSPMMGIPMTPLQRALNWFAGSWVGRGVLNPESYVPGRANNVNKTSDFESNGNTNSQARHARWQEIEKNCTKVEPSMHWLGEALKGAAQCVADANQIPSWIRVQIIGGGNDKKVDSSARDTFWGKVSGKNSANNMTIYPSGKHEPYMESDPVRDGVMNRTMSFIAGVQVASSSGSGSNSGAKSRNTRSTDGANSAQHSPTSPTPPPTQSPSEQTPKATDKPQVSPTPPRQGIGGKYKGKSPNGNPNKNR